MRTAQTRNPVFIRFVALLILLGLPLAGCVVGPGGSAPPEVAGLAERAEQGDASSQYLMGLRYTNGHGVGQDFSRATEWFDQAAASGHTEAQYMAGINYYTGRGAAVDFPKAVRLFEMAAARGHVRSFYQLGDAYANGRGVTKDLPWAVHWYEQAAHNGHDGAMLSFGVLLATGMGIATDKVAAWSWLDLADRKKQARAAAIRDRLGKSLTPAEMRVAKALVDSFGAAPRSDAGAVAATRYVQHMLNKFGFSAGPEDGILGERTRTAIRRFQVSRNLAESEEISADLLWALHLRASEKPAS